MISVPATLTVGDTWEWTAALAAYPAPTWTLTFYFENAAKKFSATAVADGDTHSVSEAAEVTAAYIAGRYYWQARVTDGSDVFTVDTGWTEVLPNPGATALHDPRSYARRVLDAVERTLEGRASSDDLRIQVAGRSLDKIPLTELLAMRDKFRAEVRLEEQGGQAGHGRQIKARLHRA